MMVRLTWSWAVLCLAMLVVGCNRDDEKSGAKSGERARPAAATRNDSQWGPAGSGGFFTEITSAVGLEDKPAPWPDGQYVVPELTPGGVAVFDFDNDGRLDILVVCDPPPSEDQFRKSKPNRLFRQTEDGKFVEVKGAAGLEGKGFHNAAAIGDVNNDGLPDVYVCNFGGPDEFFLNKGRGNFVEATAQAG